MATAYRRMPTRTLTPEHQREAARLRKLWDAKLPTLKERGHGTQRAFGEAFNIGNQAAVGFFLGGKIALSPKAAAAFSRGLEVPISAFSPRIAAMLDTAGTTSAAESNMLAAIRALPPASQRKVAAFTAGLRPSSSAPSQPGRQARRPTATPRANAKPG